MRLFAFALFIMVATAFTPAGAQDDSASNDQPSTLTPAEETVKKAAEAFVTAFNKRDAKAVAALWTETGEMSVDGVSTAVGRAAIEQSYADFFEATPGAKISVHIDSVRRIGANMIIEKGVSEIMNDDTDEIVDSYTLVHVRDGDDWLIATADVQQEVVDQIDWKGELSVLEGTWQAKRGDWRLETTCEWVADGSFLKRTYSAFDGDQKTISGVQIIGWNAADNIVTSWTFSSEGGHAQSRWQLNGAEWELAAEAVTPEGDRLTSTNLFTVLNNDTIRWQSTNRSVNGTKLDATEPVRLTRVK